VATRRCGATGKETVKESVRFGRSAVWGPAQICRRTFVCGGEPVRPKAWGIGPDMRGLCAFEDFHIQVIKK
jgi:hypothetical protein